MNNSNSRFIMELPQLKTCFFSKIYRSLNPSTSTYVKGVCCSNGFQSMAMHTICKRCEYLKSYYGRQVYILLSTPFLSKSILCSIKPWRMPAVMRTVGAVTSACPADVRWDASAGVLTFNQTALQSMPNRPHLSRPFLTKSHLIAEWSSHFNNIFLFVTM